MLSAQSVSGQITGNPNVKDPKAQPITSELQAALCGKKWICLGLTETRRGVGHEIDQNDKSVEFSCNGEFQTSFYTKGNWTVINSQIIKISVPERPNSRSLLNGVYSVYLLSDSMLVLGQILTSTGDWTKLYTFASSTKPRMSWRPASNYYAIDSLKDGRQVTYYANGQVASSESYHLVRRKMSVTELFENNFSKATYRYDPDDSTLLESVPHGEWVYYYPDGKVRGKSFYDDIGKPIGKWTRFLPDGRLEETETYNRGRWQFRDRYDYRTGETWPLVRRVKSYSEPVFVIGRVDSVQFDEVDFHEVQRADSYTNTEIGITNLSQKKVTITIPENSLFGLKTTQIDINPGDSAVLNLKIRVSASATAGQILITSSEWSFHLNVNTFGYHLSNADFDANVIKKLPSNFFFHRVSDDYQLEITGTGKDKFVAVSKQMNAIELRKGQYRFTLAGPTGRKTIDVEIQ